MNICVIGGGIIGTSTAVRIKRAFPDSKITIFSEEFSPATTGDGSAGLWLPYLDPHTPKEKVHRWSLATFQLCERLWRHKFEGDVGRDIEDLTELSEIRKAVLLLPAFELHDQTEKSAEPANAEPAGWTKIVYNFQKIANEESERMGFPKNSAGASFVTYTFEASKILPVFYTWLKAQNDVTILQRKIEKLDEKLAEFDYVINCCGIAARELVGDTAVKPVSGHVLRVKAPWINTMMAYTVNKIPTYIIPNRDSVVVGCVNRFDSWSVEPLPDESKEILDRAADLLCPSLRDAEVVSDWIGLRPFREGGVRLERQDLDLDGGEKLKVIHNYGHGGSGLTLFWGCADDVVQIIRNEEKRN